jgi:DNA modification methylase
MAKDVIEVFSSPQSGKITRDGRIALIQGDALQTLRGLPDGMVHCGITSPPYLHQRDYGTALWMDGSQECDHVQDARRTKVQGNSAFNENRPSRASTKVNGYYFKDVCGKCGARRIDAQIGLESTPEEYIAHLLGVFREFKRVLRDDGTLWIVLGDTYHKKQLLGIPGRVATALQKDGWFWRQAITWSKTNPFRESVKDRPTTSHEFVYLFAKSKTYYYDYKSIQEPAIEKHLKRYDCAVPGYNKDCVRPDGMSGGQGGMHKPKMMRRKGSVWTTSTNGYKGAHFATFPPKLIEPCVLAGCPEGGVVCDFFAGLGTTGQVALKHNRKVVLIELSSKFCGDIERRLNCTRGKHLSEHMLTGGKHPPQFFIEHGRAGGRKAAARMSAQQRRERARRAAAARWRTGSLNV